MDMRESQTGNSDINKEEISKNGIRSIIRFNSSKNYSSKDDN